MRKIVTLVLAASALIVAGCNTVAGIGRYVSAAGQAVEETAEDVAN